MIQLQNLVKTYHMGTSDATRVLDNLSLNVPEGQFLVVLGSNGAGKSTLMNCIAGTILVDSGSIQIGSQNVTRQREFERARWIGRVFQDPMLGTAADLTVAENLCLAIRRGKMRSFLRSAVRPQILQRLKDSVSELGLGLEKRWDDRVGLLSGGQRQALTLTMAALERPEVVLLDEHTAALDPKTAQIVMGVTEKIIRENRLTALMITHNLDHARHHGDRTVILHAGQVAYDLSAADIRNLSLQELMNKFSLPTL